ncbi:MULTISPECIES: glycosyltransferase [Dyella]|uniref:Glycosyltransferase n=2 Tax=Dyella TaxID=231454 RepID=A0A4R0YIX6_9GAMM|nr:MULTISPECIES: glycosyltransferase [Dyella]TBR36508.1 glycosyltransferase [Dyella terrae]TCI08400.1 glycosyltransferase [Dyella soli]
MTRLNVIGRDNGAGLSRDMHLLADALREGGLDAQLTALPHRGGFAELLTRLQWQLRKPAFDINLMLERIRPEYWRAAHRNVLIPNPEYFRDKDRAQLHAMDAAWVKTRHAERLFGALGVRTHYIGFNSPDRLLPAVPRERTFFHGPGRSGNKGTRQLIDLWARHPEWPTLTVAWRRKRVDVGDMPPNVQLLRDHIDDTAYQELQNRHVFHLCPSQTEGFGHYLVEAMSCRAVVITLDAEPMNELVTGARGVLVQARASGTQDLATLYEADEASLEQAIERCIAMPDHVLTRLGSAARAWFESNRDGFAGRLRDAVACVHRSAAS